LLDSGHQASDRLECVAVSLHLLRTGRLHATCRHASYVKRFRSCAPHRSTQSLAMTWSSTASSPP
jgi:hypothetical protein